MTGGTPAVFVREGEQMGYRTILYVSNDDDQNEQRLRIARALASRWHGRLIVLHITPPVIIPVGFAEGLAYIPPEVTESQQASAALITEKLKEDFRRVCEPFGDVPAEWRHVQGEPAALAIQAALAADLTVIGAAPTSGIDALARSLVEDLVLGSGGPVLVLPAGWSEATIGRHVVLAWNRSREAARALHDSRGFMREAEQTAVVSLGEDYAASVADVVASQQAHGIATEADSRPDDSDAGNALLAIAADRGADLLAMGAYGRGRLSELILGGATRDVLREARLPVLFSA